MDEKKINPIEEVEEGLDEDVLVLTLEDEDGNSYDFIREAETTMDGNLYYALVPLDESFNDAEGDYLILKVIEDGEEISFENLDEDEEDRVAEYFDDLFFSEVNYDEQ